MFNYLYEKTIKIVNNILVIQKVMYILQQVRKMRSYIVPIWKWEATLYVEIIF